MVQKKRKIIDGKTYKLYRSYASKEKAKSIASQLKDKGIYRNGVNLIASHVRVIELESKTNPRPFRVYTNGLRKIKLTNLRQKRTKRT